jgi:hypothetical protein
MQVRATRLAVVILVASLSMGCASSNKGTTAGSSANSMAAAATGAASLYSSLGGSSGVNALASQFGANLSANHTISTALSAADIVTAKDGLYNSIAKLAGQATKGSGADLLGALSGKSLSADAVGGVGKALTEAAVTKGLKPDQMAALGTLWEPIGKSLLSGK